MHLYEAQLTEKPALAVDRREIVEACFVHPGALLEMRYGNKVAGICADMPGAELA